MASSSLSFCPVLSSVASIDMAPRSGIVACGSLNQRTDRASDGVATFSAPLKPLRPRVAPLPEKAMSSGGALRVKSIALGPPRRNSSGAASCRSMSVGSPFQTKEPDIRAAEIRRWPGDGDVGIGDAAVAGTGCHAEHAVAHVDAPQVVEARHEGREIVRDLAVFRIAGIGRRSGQGRLDWAVATAALGRRPVLSLPAAARRGHEAVDRRHLRADHRQLLDGRMPEQGVPEIEVGNHGLGCHQRLHVAPRRAEPDMREADLRLRQEAERGRSGDADRQADQFGQLPLDVGPRGIGLQRHAGEDGESHERHGQQRDDDRRHAGPVPQPPMARRPCRGCLPFDARHSVSSHAAQDGQGLPGT